MVSRETILPPASGSTLSGAAVLAALPERLRSRFATIHAHGAVRLEYVDGERSVQERLDDIYNARVALEAARFCALHDRFGVEVFPREQLTEMAVVGVPCPGCGEWTAFDCRCPSTIPASAPMKEVA